MAVILSHNTALEFLRAVPPQIWQPPYATEEDFLSEPTERTFKLNFAAIRSYGIRQIPVHVLITRSTYRTGRDEFTIHTGDPAALPPDSLLKLSSDLYTCCPELTFVQMATVTSQLGLIVLGYELCGSYAHFSQLISGFYDRQPLTSTANIRRYLDELYRTRGLLRARTALQWVRDGSRSPMETVVSCMLFLPGDMGGWGRATPALNHVVKLDKAASRITRTKTAKVDLSWPELKIGIEYDSKTFHQDPEKDRKRREALTHMGWTIYVINLDEIKSYPNLEAKVELFIDQIPCAPHTKAANKQDRRQLLDRLLTATRFGLGLNNALFGLPVQQGTITTHL